MNDSETIETLGDKYRGLDRCFPARGVEAIDTGCLLTFPYPDDGAPQDVLIETDEFTALCPWTGLPDYGKLVVCYTPDRRSVEPLIRAPEAVQPAGVRRVRVVDGAILERESAHAGLLPRVGRQVRSHRRLLTGV